MMMSLCATKVSGWLQEDTSSIMIPVEHYTNTTKLNEILKWQLAIATADNTMISDQLG